MSTPVVLFIDFINCIVYTKVERPIMTKKINYLNNKDIMAEIHRSKNTYCSFTLPEYHQYDLILSDVNKINAAAITSAKQARAKRLGQEAFEKEKALSPKVKLSEFEVNPDTINKLDLVFRIMTYEHIPLAPGRKKTPKTLADHREKVNFPAFQHWKFSATDELICVGKSHWTGPVDTGSFDKSVGQITDTLARMYIKLCERYATKGNVRGYTYNEEMKGQAILQLTQIGLQFDESKSDNPFAYFTAAVTNSFVRVINIEKKMQNIRDDMLQEHGMSPSYTRTINAEYETNTRREAEATAAALAESTASALTAETVSDTDESIEGDIDFADDLPDLDLNIEDTDTVEEDV